MDCYFLWIHSGCFLGFYCLCWVLLILFLQSVSCSVAVHVFQLHMWRLVPGRKQRPIQAPLTKTEWQWKFFCTQCSYRILLQRFRHSEEITDIGRVSVKQMSSLLFQDN